MMKIMRILFFIEFIFASFFLAGNDVILTISFDKNAFSYSSPETAGIVDCGLVPFDKKITKQVLLDHFSKNPPIEILNIRSHCSCIVIPDMAPVKLDREKQFRFPLEINSRGYWGVIIRDVTLRLKSGNFIQDVRIPIQFKVTDDGNDANQQENQNFVRAHNAKTSDVLPAFFPKEVNFGKHPYDQRQTRIVKINNSSDETIEFGMVRTSCSCLDADLAAHSLAPGKFTELTVSLHEGQMRGEYVQNIYVMLPDHPNKYQKIEVKGNAVSDDSVSLEKTVKSFPVEGNNGVLVEYFYRANCMDCAKISQEILPALERQCSGKYKLERYELSDETNFKRLLSRLESLGDTTSNETIYVILNKKRIIAGPVAIRKDLIASIQDLSEQESLEMLGDENNRLHDDFSGRIRLGAVLLAGFLDGFNPCVFATLIFFMSLLIGAHPMSKQRLIAVGTVYTSACFLTYFLLGLGIFQVIGWTGGFPHLRMILNSGIALTLCVLSIFSFRDAASFTRTHDHKRIILALPDRLRDKIHKIMRNIRYGKFLMTGIFVSGVLVTLLESVCSGQVYVPTLLLLIREDGLVSGWLFYLLIYNMMFILPLIVLLVLTIGGISIRNLLNLGRRQLVVSKILLGSLFLLLAGLLIYFEFFNS